MKTPHLSIGLPVYNGEQYLRQSIESILNQTYEGFELIISDNASIDATQEICLNYAKKDSRVRYHRSESNLGAAPNHNRVFQLATADLFKWVAHDDECHPELLARCMETMAGSPDSVVLVYPQAELIDSESQVIGRYDVSIACPDKRPHKRFEKVVTCMRLGTPMYGVLRREALLKTRLHGSFISADVVMMAELALAGEIREIAVPLLRKRMHPGRSMEANHTKNEHRAWFDSRNRNHQDLLSSADRLNLEYLRGVLRFPLRMSEKLPCLLVILAAMASTQRKRVGDWRRRLVDKSRWIQKGSADKQVL